MRVATFISFSESQNHTGATDVVCPPSFSLSARPCSSLFPSSISHLPPRKKPSRNNSNLFPILLRNSAIVSAAAGTLRPSLSGCGWNDSTLSWKRTAGVGREGVAEKGMQWKCSWNVIALV